MCGCVRTAGQVLMVSKDLVWKGKMFENTEGDANVLRVGILVMRKNAVAVVPSVVAGVAQVVNPIDFCFRYSADIYWVL